MAQSPVPASCNFLAFSTISAISSFSLFTVSRFDSFFGKPKDPYEAIDQADALLLVTQWPQFRPPDFERTEGLLNNKLIFDGDNSRLCQFLLKNLIKHVGETWLN